MFGAHSVLPSCTTGLPTEAPTQSPYIPSGKSSIVHWQYIMFSAHSVLLHVPQVYQLRLQLKLHMELPVNPPMCIATILCLMPIPYPLHALQVYQLSKPQMELPVNPLLCIATVNIFCLLLILYPPHAPQVYPLRLQLKAHTYHQVNPLLCIGSILYLVLILYPFMHHRYINTDSHTRSNCKSWFVMVVAHQPLSYTCVTGEPTEVPTHLPPGPSGSNANTCTGI